MTTTVARRMSCLSVAIPFNMVLTSPNGMISQAERQDNTMSYIGVSTLNQIPIFVGNIHLHRR